MLDISIVIVNWNTREMTLRCLDSIAASARGLNCEVVLVDNASTDGSANAIAAAHPGVKLIRNGHNVGFAGANNQGLEVIAGRYVALINSDVVVLPGCLQALMLFMDANPRVGLSSARILNPDGTLQPNCMRFPTYWNVICETLGLHNLSKLDWLSGRRILNWNYNTTREVDVIVGCFWFARREASAAVGPLDASFFMYGEDMDWCRRFHEAGWRVVLCPEGQAIHFGGQSSAHAPVRFYIELHRAGLRYWRKYHGLGGWAYAVCLAYLHQVLRIVAGLLLYAMRPGKREEIGGRIRRSAACLVRLLGGAIGHG